MGEGGIRSLAPLLMTRPSLRSVLRAGGPIYAFSNTFPHVFHTVYSFIFFSHIYLQISSYFPHISTHIGVELGIFKSQGGEGAALNYSHTYIDDSPSLRSELCARKLIFHIFLHIPHIVPVHICTGKSSKFFQVASVRIMLSGGGLANSDFEGWFARREKIQQF